MARRIIEIDSMTTDDCTFSVGIVHGGLWVNCVATTCSGEALSMAKRQADLDRGVERMLALSSTANGVTFTVTRGVTRPVWEPNAATMALYEKAKGIAKDLGMELPTPRPAAALTRTSPARWAWRRSTASACAAPIRIRS